MELSKYLSGGRLQRLVLKELRESLRDRRTVVTLVLMPILVYPLLGMVLQRLLLTTAIEPSKTSYVIGVENEEKAVDIDRLLFEAQRLVNEGSNTLIAPRRWDGRDGTDNQLSGNSAQISSSNSTTGSESISDRGFGSQEDDLSLPDVSSSDSLTSVPGNRTKVTEKNFAIPEFKLVLVEDTTLERALYRGSIDIAITHISRSKADGDGQKLSDSITRRFRTPGETIYSNGFDVEIQYRRGDARSEDASILLRRMCQVVNDQQLQFLLQALDENLKPAIQLKSIGIGKPLDTAASIASVIPLVLILMTITGAVYPAIDLTAGERERGTMEAMIATPAPRFALLLSKYFAVVSVSILTALANLFATWMTLSFGGLGRAIFGEGGFGLGTLLQILPILILFAAFFSSILLALCSFAKTFKEAQAYLIPVMLVSLAPGLVTLMPNIEFTNVLAVVPLLNVLLLSRDIMTGVPPLVPTIIAVVTTIAYGSAALVVASHLFGAANSMVSNQATWSEFLRGGSKPSEVPDLGALALYLAFLFPTLFVVSSFGSMFAGQTELLMGLNAITLFMLFLVGPLLWVCLRRHSVRKTFLLWSQVKPRSEYALSDKGNESIRAQTEGHLEADIVSPNAPSDYVLSPLLRWSFTGIAVAMLSATLWMFALEGVLLFKAWSLSSIVPEIEKLKQSWMEIPFVWILLTQALVPAIAEEFFFRGFSLTALRSKLSATWGVVLSALLFGWFHVITGNVLSLEKFVPTFALGLVLGYIAVATRSIWPGIALHACHNAIVLGFTRLEKEDLVQWFGNGEHIPLALLVPAAVIALIGLALIKYANKSPIVARKKTNCHTR